MVSLDKRTDLFFAVKVVLCAVAALVVLSTWFVHPAMSGEMREAGRLLVWLLMIGVVVAAVCALIIGPGSHKD